jgi:hypothetical protein
LVDDEMKEKLVDQEILDARQEAVTETLTQDYLPVELPQQPVEDQTEVINDVLEVQTGEPAPGLFDGIIVHYVEASKAFVSSPIGF